MNIFYAPNFDLAKSMADGIDISIEAEYGDEVIAGKIYTAAHHGSRSTNPAPCVDINIPVISDGTILVSHLDLDTLGGIARALGYNKIIQYNDFWLVAAFKDVYGPHKTAHATNYSQEISAQLDAYSAWAENNRKFYPRDKATDVTEDVLLSIKILSRILDNDPELINAGREWRQKIDELDAASLVSQHGRLLVRVSDKFVSAFYKKDADIIVAFSTKNKTITLSTADEDDGIDCVKIMQKLFGPKAGGRRVIAGSPRGQVMDFFDLAKVVNEIIL